MKKQLTEEDCMRHHKYNYDNIEGSACPLPSTPYKACIIIGGTNDLGNKNFSYGDISENLITMYDYCLEQADIEVVVVCSIPSSPLDGRHDEWYVSKKALVNKAIEEYATTKKTEKKIVFVDLMNGLNFNNCNPEEQKLYWDDNLHFTPTGSDKLAEIIFNTLVSCKVVG